MAHDEAVAQRDIGATADREEPAVGMAGVALAGSVLDVSEWIFRKSIPLVRSGAQQVELDLDALAHAQPGFADLRILRGSNQVPYLVQRTSISRTLTPMVTLTNDAKQPKLSSWLIKLPRAGLPLNFLNK